MNIFDILGAIMMILCILLMLVAVIGGVKLVVLL